MDVRTYHLKPIHCRALLWDGTDASQRAILEAFPTVWGSAVGGYPFLEFRSSRRLHLERRYLSHLEVPMMIVELPCGIVPFAQEAWDMLATDVSHVQSATTWTLGAHDETDVETALEDDLSWVLPQSELIEGQTFYAPPLRDVKKEGTP